MQLPVLLREASADRDLEVGPVGLHRLEPAEVAVELVVGVLADAARVEHDHVGGVDVVGRHQPVRREEARDALGVVLVHLAPVGADVEAADTGGGLRHGRPVYGDAPDPVTVTARNGRGTGRAGAGCRGRVPRAPGR